MLCEVKVVRHNILKLQLILSGLLLAAAQFVPVAAQEDSGPIFGLVTETLVDVRVGPDFAYPIIGQVPRDASVVIVGRTGTFFRRFTGQQWLQIEYGDRLGWVAARVMRIGVPFNSIPETALQPPRDRNGRVPEGFDLSSEICTQWVGAFTQSGNFMAGDTELTVTYPPMPGATNYVITAIAPSGLERSFDSQTTTATIPLGRLNFEAGVYRWQVTPVWNITANPFRAQEVCLPRTGGTFEKPDTTPPPEQ